MKRWVTGAVALGAGVYGACGSPSVHDSANGAASHVDSPDAGPDGGELPGVAPKCTNVAPDKMKVGDSVAVPGGAFRMGCDPGADPECKDDEKPAHDVNLDTFSIDKTEVTQAQYYGCVKDGKCTFPKCEWDPCADPDKPIACVKHGQAEAYCGWAGKRLPSEAEWEKAARGADGRKYPWGNDPVTCDLANFLGCGKSTWNVGSHPGNASPFGAFDMAGNVVEWTSDWYDPSYYKSSPPSSPHGPPAGDAYSGRGGGFLSEAVWQRTAKRDLYEPTYTRVSMGIRCAK